MKTKKINAIVSKILLFALSFVLVFTLFGCENTVIYAPEVKGVTLTAEEGYETGELNVQHTLSYTATDGSEVTVSVKKGSENATSSDCTYNTSSVTFLKAGKYTITVKAEKDGLSDEESLTCTAYAAAPVLTDATLRAKSGAKYGRTGQEHILNYTASAGSEASVSVKKDGHNAEAADYTYTEATKIITFNRVGEYEVIVTAAKNGQQTKKSACISVYDLEAPGFTEAASIAAKAGATAGKVGNVHVISWQVEAEAEVVFYKNGQLAVAGTDYNFNETNKEVTFLTEGEYEVVVVAVGADSKVAKSVASIDITGGENPVISNIVLTPSAYGYMRGQEIGLSYEVDIPNNAYPVEDCAPAVITVLKGAPDGEGGYTYAEMTESNSYTYNSETKKLTFRNAGNYKVVVSVTAHGATGSASAVLDVRNFARPTFNFTLSGNETGEGGSVTMTTGKVTYATGDEQKSGGETFSYYVQIRANDEAEWESADGKYEVNGNVFTAKLAGEYKITAYIESKQGRIGLSSQILRVTVKGMITLTPSANYTGKYMRVALNTDVALDYTINDPDGVAGNYDLIVEADEGYSVSGTSVTANFSKAGAYMARITYAHKSVPSVRQTIVYNLYAADANSPTFVGDPFGEIDVLVPDVGVMLYASITKKDGGAVSNVSYEFVGDHTGIEIKHIANNNNYPYYLLAGSNHVDEFMLKMTFSDGVNTMSVKKLYTVKELGKGKDYEDMKAYAEAVYGADNDLSFENTSSDMRPGLCLTNTGFIANRESENMSSKPNGDCAWVEVGAKNNFQIDFTMTYYGDNTVTGTDKKDMFSLSLGFRTVNHDGWAGNIAVKKKSDTSVDAYSWINSQKNDKWVGAFDIQKGKSYYVRVKNTLTDSTVKYEVYFSATGADDGYTLKYSCECPVASEAGKGGAPVYIMQFGYEAGCFGVENVVLTDLG